LPVIGDVISDQSSVIVVVIAACGSLISLMVHHVSRITFHASRVTIGCFACCTIF
jgi:hypothetical protein